MIAGLLALPGKLKLYAGVALAAIAAATVFYFKARQAGIDSVKAEQDAARLRAVQQKKAVDDEVSKLTPQHRDDELARWMRDAPPR